MAAVDLLFFYQNKQKNQVGDHTSAGLTATEMEESAMKNSQS